jgi:asparagine synthase (glutamine-hydrolysing)
MCGIAGILNRNRAVSPALLEAMGERLIHRGPDGGSQWIDAERTIGFAHRRLAIIDLSDAAIQPMHTSDDRYHLIFNGEIYNHRQLREDLIKQGCISWQTDHSDTEVILNAYALWGIACLEKLRGMFAFALWDSTLQKLFLARDRIGEKPLYYTVNQDNFLFASEIKSLLCDKTLQRKMSEKGLLDFLSFLTVPAPYTLFEGIYKLEAGYYLEIDTSLDIKKTQYWDVWTSESQLNQQSMPEITEKILEKLQDSIALRTESDVPVGVFLSGGIDSSANAVILSQQHEAPIATFSIGYDKSYPSYQNELNFAEKIADKIHSNHHEKHLNLDDLLNFLPRMIYHQDEPIADPVCIPVYYLSEFAVSKGYKVCQLGEGADELFIGYNRWKRYHQLQNLSNIKGLKPLQKMLKYLLYPFMKNTMSYELLSRACRGQPIFWSGAEAFGHHEKFSILSPRMKKKFKDYTAWEVIKPHYEKFSRVCPEKSDLNWKSYIDLKVRLPELLLMRVDKMSMAASLEGRVPFLDHDFVEFAMSLPSHLKLQNNELKFLLKKAFETLLPHEILYRPKQGFGVPLDEWLLSSMADSVRISLKQFCDNTDVLSYRAVEKLFKKKKTKQLWYLYNLALWWEQFIVNAE